MYRVVNYSNKECLLKYFYNTGDEAFIKNFHKDSGSIDSCIDSSLEALSSNKINTFVILKKRKPVAYFGRDGDSLVGFFIHPKYRNDKRNIFNLIIASFKSGYIHTCLSVKNVRAIKFLLNNNFSIDKVHSFYAVELVRR